MSIGKAAFRSNVLTKHNKRINVCYWPLGNPDMRLPKSPKLGLSRLRDFQSVIHLNPQIPHRAFQLGVTQ